VVARGQPFRDIRLKYLKILAGRTKIAGIDISVTDSPVIQ
jgi:hypothetical protein